MNTPGLLIAAGSLLRWYGLFCVFRCLYLGSLRWFQPVGYDSATNWGRIFRSALTGAIALLVSVPLIGAPMFMELPVFWPMMSPWGWIALLGAWMVVFRLAQQITGSSGSGGRWFEIAGWAAGGLLGFWLFKLDPKNTLTILHGSIPLSPISLGVLILLVLAAVIAMGAGARYVAVRGATKTAISHTLLIIGSFIFGLPFLWLVITSFKEDRDMSAPAGLVWIPKVQETRPVRDPNNPLLTGKYKGLDIQANVEKRYDDGSVLVDVVKPQSLAGANYRAPLSSFKEIDRNANVVSATYQGQKVTALDLADDADGTMHLKILEPKSLEGTMFKELVAKTDPVRHIGLKWDNYPNALEFLPIDAHYGIVYLQNTLVLVILSVVGTLLSSSIVAYAFSRLRFPGREQLFALVLSTLMLPAAVTMLPRFLIFKNLGWIDSLNPLWVPAFFGSAFNIFLLRQFLKNIPLELEDAAKIDGCSYLRTFWSVMIPQIQPALAVIGIWTFMGAWNDFMGPLIYVSSPEHMTISYAVQMFNSDRSGEPGYLMAFTTMAMLPVLALFVFAQRYFIEGVTLSGLGGR